MHLQKSKPSLEVTSVTNYLLRFKFYINPSEFILQKRRHPDCELSFEKIVLLNEWDFILLQASSILLN